MTTRKLSSTDSSGERDQKLACAAAVGESVLADRVRYAGSKV